MNTRDHQTLHLYINSSKWIANSKNGSGCKWTRETIKHYTYTLIQVNEWLTVRTDKGVNVHERPSNITLINEHERPSNITLINEQGRPSNITLIH
jgi:hypothetical protein